MRAAPTSTSGSGCRPLRWCALSEGGGGGLCLASATTRALLALLAAWPHFRTEPMQIDQGRHLQAAMSPAVKTSTPTPPPPPPRHARSGCDRARAAPAPVPHPAGAQRHRQDHVRRVPHVCPLARRLRGGAAPAPGVCDGVGDAQGAGELVCVCVCVLGGARVWVLVLWLREGPWLIAAAAAAARQQGLPLPDMFCVSKQPRTAALPLPATSSPPGVQGLCAPAQRPARGDS
jgi:hypothetical protein